MQETGCVVDDETGGWGGQWGPGVAKGSSGSGHMLQVEAAGFSSGLIIISTE